MADPAPRPLKTIFVISPIGKLDETGFDYTRLFLDEIVKPAAKLAGGYAVPVRGDEVKAPGNITAKIVTDIVNKAVQKGLLLEAAGPGNVIRFLCPLCVTDAQLAAGLDIFEETLKDCM